LVDLHTDLYNGFQACRHFFIAEDEDAQLFQDRMANLRILAHACQVSRKKKGCAVKFKLRLPREMYDQLEKSRDVSDIAYELSIRSQFGEEKKSPQVYDVLHLLYMEQMIVFLASLQPENLELVRKLGYALHNCPGREENLYGGKGVRRLIVQSGVPIDVGLMKFGHVFWGRDWNWPDKK
jgi:hypothetical protein